STLQDFAFAMGIGVLSGGYSSIFIATPVLTHWKEREPAYRARRQRLVDEMGYLPTFPEENVVAKLGDEERKPEPAPRVPAQVGAATERAGTEAVATEEAPPQRAPAEVDGDDGAEPAPKGEPGAPVPEGDGAKAERQQQREQRRKRQQRRRRKHGRHR